MSGGLSSPSPAGVVPLRLAEGVALCAAWTQSVAHARSMRVLIIKGDTLAHHGLREDHVSADLDILVDPEHVDGFAEALIEHGWRKRSDAFPEQVDAPHSLTLIHAQWPCDIDIHRYFPGLLEPPSVAFEQLWSRRESMSFAHQSCDIPDRLSSLMLLILNRLRSVHSETTSIDTSTPALSAAEVNELAGVARVTGASFGLESTLIALGYAATIEIERQWIIEAGTGDHGGRLAVLAMRRSDFGDKMRIAARAVMGRSEFGGTRRPFRERLRRGLRGIRGLFGDRVTAR